MKQYPLVRSAVAALAASALLALRAVAAPVSYTGGTYSQTFDGLPGTADSTTPFAQTFTSNGQGPYELSGVTGATNMDGWYAANNGGSAQNLEFHGHDGRASGSTGRGVVSFGTDGTTDRALGALPTSNNIGRWGAIFINNSTQTFSAADVSFFTEQWRRGDVAAPGDTAAFAYAIDPTATGNINAASFTNYTALDAATVNSQAAINVALNGNDPSNRQAVASRITGINWTPGSALLVRWSISDVAGQDNGLSIDSFNLTGVVPEPTSLAFVALAGGIVARRRQR